MIQGMYPIQHAARSEFISIRQLSYHVLQWGTPSDDKTPLVMLHGWMDVAASFQLVAEYRPDAVVVIDDDLRGTLAEVCKKNGWTFLKAFASI